MPPPELFVFAQRRGKEGLGRPWRVRIELSSRQGFPEHARLSPCLRVSVVGVHLAADQQMNADGRRSVHRPFSSAVSQFG
jgi:hypothetical protein